ncbi:phosphosulfolactate synthase [Sediminibacillus massiliensis]|uniref:phosphosulfolactate synthase n=1 Tax=Sediminibacillus massiliensis TaxID=1926277 RepID=UPI0009887D20|nr:phosphosulfolactate synthase [Sediminibacillus massiliensis]
MNSHELTLPTRETKPRQNGQTILIDNGVPLQLFRDTISSTSEYVDFVKFGWGTSIITGGLQEKIDCLQKENVAFFFGGTLFEKFLSQDKVEAYMDYCQSFGCRYVEISNGTINLSNRKKAEYISAFSGHFTVFSEVGSKDSAASTGQDSSEWMEFILEDLEAGADKVITEARESGTSGICREDGDIRFDIFEEILSSNLGIEQLIFEAPNKKMQTFFIKRLGPNVNLANIPFTDPIALETLRLGLRSDTFHLVKGGINREGYK